MCYFLYGAINDGINVDDYEKTIKDTEYHFRFGNITSVNECVASCDNSYRITLNHCDCDTAIGQKHTNKKYTIINNLKTNKKVNTEKNYSFFHILKS